MPSFNQLLQIRNKVKGKKLKKPAKWLFPHNAERKYRRILRKLVRELSGAIRERLIPAIPDMIDQVDSRNPNNDRNDDFLSLLNGIIISIQEFIAPRVQEAITEMEQVANEIAIFNEEQFQK